MILSIDISQDIRSNEILGTAVSRPHRALFGLMFDPEPVSLSTIFTLVSDPRKIRVFVTYSLDSKEHMKNVVGLCDCMKKNGFSISIDFRENQLVAMDRIGWIDTRFQSVSVNML